MADKKISQLTAASTPLAGTEVLPIVQGGTTVKATIANVVGAGTSQGKFTSLIATASGAVTTFGSSTAANLYSQWNYNSSGVGYIGNGAAIVSAGGATDFAVGAANKLFLVSNSGANYVVVDNGNIAPIADKGIDFSANGGDVLTQYDEGTWTPAPNSGTFSSASGTYTRIGRQVTLTFDIVVGTGGGTTMTAPIASAITTANGIYTDGQLFGAGTTSPTVVIGGSGNTIYFRSVGSAVGFSAMTLTAGATITGVLTYTV